MLLLISILVSVGAIVVIAIGVVSVNRLTRGVAGEDRTYLDPLPRLLRLLWPLVKFVDHHAGGRFGASLLARVEQRLRVTGMLFLMSARQFMALRIVSTAVALLLGLLCAAMLGTVPMVVLLALALLGYWYPGLWLNDIRRRHQQRILTDLPVYLDFLTLGVEAGLNLNGAITQAVEKGPDGPLRRELEHVLRDLKSGLSRADALRRWQERVEIREITQCVGALIQADRMGSGMAGVLRFQSDARRAERFQRAEKQAMEAPVKLVFPLLVFIFPVTFIVLFFPIAMKFIQEGVF